MGLDSSEVNDMRDLQVWSHGSRRFIRLPPVCGKGAMIQRIVQGGRREFPKFGLSNAGLERRNFMLYLAALLLAVLAHTPFLFAARARGLHAIAFLHREWVSLRILPTIPGQITNHPAISKHTRQR